MPFAIRLCIVLAISFYICSVIVLKGYEKEIRMAAVRNRIKECPPALIAGCLVLLSWIFILFVVFWIILFGIW